MALDKKMLVFSNVYTALLAIALGAVIATSAFVALMCLAQYSTFFKIAQI